MSKTVSSVQDSALNQFRHAAMGNTNDKTAEYMAISAEKRRAFEEKMKGQEQPFLRRGFTKTTLERIEKKQAENLLYEQQRLQNSIDHRNRHSMVNELLDVFGILDNYDASTLAKFNKTEHEIFKNEKNIVSMKIGRCLSSSIKIQFNVSYLKKYYKQSESFAIDKSVESDFKWIETVENITAKYGNLINFRRNLLPKIATIIENYSIQNLNNSEENELDIWTFKFE